MAGVGGYGLNASGTTVINFPATQPPTQYPTSGNTPWADIAAGTGDTGGHVNTHAFRYYRVWTADGTSISGFGAAEIEMAVYPSGPDTTLGQTYTSSTNFAGQPASNAFDDNSATEFATDFTGAQPYWIKVDYGATAGNWIAANELRIRAPATAFHALRDFSWQGSDDNSTWTTLYSTTTQPAWSIGETRSYVATAGGSTGINGSLSATLGALTLSSTSQLLIKGSLNKTLGTLTSTATGKLLIKGSVNKTLGILTLSSTSHVIVSGSLSKTLGVLTGSAVGKLLLKGSLTQVLGTLTSASTGRVLIRGSVNTTLGNLTGTETGQLLIKGSVNKTLDTLVLASTGQSAHNGTGTLIVILGPVTLNSNTQKLNRLNIRPLRGLKSSVQDQLRTKRLVYTNQYHHRIIP